MRKAGGFIAVIVGLIGGCVYLSGPFILLFLAYAYTHNISMKELLWFFQLEYPGIIFSILVITLGAIAIFIKSKIPGILLILVSITYPLFLLGKLLVVPSRDINIEILFIMSNLLGAIAGILIIFGSNSKETQKVKSKTEQIEQDN